MYIRAPNCLLTVLHVADFVYVFDGDSTDSTLLATFTGSPALPIQIVSSGKKVMIHMTSDGSVQDVGFSFKNLKHTEF